MSQSKCGCRIDHFPYHNGRPYREEIVYCPFHASAGKLLEAAKYALEVLEYEEPPQSTITMAKLESAIQQAEGKG